MVGKMGGFGLEWFLRGDYLNNGVSIFSGR
jgi:hypothetical protein